MVVNRAIMDLYVTILIARTEKEIFEHALGCTSTSAGNVHSVLTTHIYTMTLLVITTKLR